MWYTNILSEITVLLFSFFFCGYSHQWWLGIHFTTITQVHKVAEVWQWYQPGKCDEECQTVCQCTDTLAMFGYISCQTSLNGWPWASAVFHAFPPQRCVTASITYRWFSARLQWVSNRYAAILKQAFDYSGCWASIFFYLMHRILHAWSYLLHVLTTHYTTISGFYVLLDAMELHHD